MKDLPAIIILFKGDRGSSLGSFDSQLLPKNYEKTPNKVRRAFHGTSFRPLIVAKHLEISVNDDEEPGSNQAHFGGSFFFYEGRLDIWAPTADFQTFNGDPVYATSHM